MRGDDVTQDQAFAHAIDVLKKAVGGISDSIRIPGAGQTMPPDSGRSAPLESRATQPGSAIDFRS